jgi:hypothetical protein
MRYALQFPINDQETFGKPVGLYNVAMPLKFNLRIGPALKQITQILWGGETDLKSFLDRPALGGDLCLVDSNEIQAVPGHINNLFTSLTSNAAKSGLPQHSERGIEFSQQVTCVHKI